MANSTPSPPSPLKLTSPPTLSLPPLRTGEPPTLPRAGPERGGGDAGRGGPAGITPLAGHTENSSGPLGRG